MAFSAMKTPLRIPSEYPSIRKNALDKTARSTAYTLNRLRYDRNAIFPDEESTMALPQSRDLTEKAILLIRILVGWVFVSEGIQKFLFSATLGVGRFAKIGILYPHFTAPFVGAIEIVCGSLILLGLLARWATLPLLAIMAVAIATTKIPMLSTTGLWSMLHEARADFSMTLGLLFLLLAGAGSLAFNHPRR